VSTPFDPETWPPGYGPRDVSVSAGSGVPPPADESVGEGPPSPAELNVTEFIGWVKLQLGRVETYGGALAKDKPAWCPEWWNHPEVVERLIVAYQAYVRASASQHEGDMLALSAWWVQHWDHHAAIIFDPARGPFRACNYKGHLTLIDRDTLTIMVQDPPGSWEP
jgi:hypothetical protein